MECIILSNVMLCCAVGGVFLWHSMILLGLGEHVNTALCAAGGGALACWDMLSMRCRYVCNLSVALLSHATTVLEVDASGWCLAKACFCNAHQEMCLMLDLHLVKLRATGPLENWIRPVASRTMHMATRGQSDQCVVGVLPPWLAQSNVEDMICWSPP